MAGSANRRGTTDSARALHPATATHTPPQQAPHTYASHTHRRTQCALTHALATSLATRHTLAAHRTLARAARSRHTARSQARWRHSARPRHASARTSPRACNTPRAHTRARDTRHTRATRALAAHTSLPARAPTAPHGARHASAPHIVHLPLAADRTATLPPSAHHTRTHTAGTPPQAATGGLPSPPPPRTRFQLARRPRRTVRSTSRTTTLRPTPRTRHLEHHRSPPTRTRTTTRRRAVTQQALQPTAASHSLPARAPTAPHLAHHTSHATHCAPRFARGTLHAARSTHTRTQDTNAPTRRGAAVLSARRRLTLASGSRAGRTSHRCCSPLVAARSRAPLAPTRSAAAVATARHSTAARRGGLRLLR